MSLGSSGTQKVKSETTIPWYQQKTGEYLYNQGSQQAQQPYQAYAGNRVAPFSGEQEAAYQNTVKNLGTWAPYLNNATTATSNAAANWVDPGVAQKYGDPYQQAVTDIAKREAERAYGIQSKLNAGRAAQAGAWGGSQAGVAQAAGQRDFLQQLSDIQAQGSERGYQSGMQAFNADRANQLAVGQQFAGLGSALQGLQNQDLSRLEAVGAARQGQVQKGLDQQYSDFAEGRDWNKNNLSWLASLMQQTPSPQSTTQTSKAPSGSTAGQVLGGAQSLGSLAAMFYLMSDRRLKQDIQNIGKDETGLNVYQFRYTDNPDEEYIGYMADEVRELYPHAVVRIGEYDAVAYGAL